MTGELISGQAALTKLLSALVTVELVTWTRYRYAQASGSTVLVGQCQPAQNTQDETKYKHDINELGN